MEARPQGAVQVNGIKMRRVILSRRIFCASFSK